MAKQRPNLGTFASPTSQLVTPVQQQATPLNEQAIRDAYAFADSFSELSSAMGSLVTTLKQESNKEQVLLGQNMVNSSRKTYSQLVQEGKIKPSENPWLAVGAQEASGSIEAYSARNELKAEYESRVAENPALLDDSKFFDSLVASYMDRKNAEFGSSQYLISSFYDKFNPMVLDLQAKNADAIGERRISKIVSGVTATVDMALEDSIAIPLTTPIETQFPSTGTLAEQKAWWDEASKPTRNRNDYIDKVIIPKLQLSLDEAGKNSGFPEMTNKAAIESLVERMKTSNNPEIAERILGKLKGGTGLLRDTEFGRQILAANENQIRANFERMTHEDSREMTSLAKSLADKIFNGSLTAEEAESQFRTAAERKISANEIESKIPFMNSLVSARREAMQREIKAYAKRDVAFTSAVIERSKSSVDFELGQFTQTAIDTVSTGVTTAEERAVLVDQYQAMLREKSFVKDDLGSSVMERKYDDDGNLLSEIPAQNYTLLDISEKSDKFISAIENTHKRGLDRKTQNAIDASSNSVATEIQENGGVLSINFNSLASTFSKKMAEAGVTTDNVKAKAARDQLAIGVKQSFAKAEEQLASRLGVSSLTPSQNDPLRAEKANARGMLALNKFAYAVAFGDGEYISEFRNSVRSLVTTDLEAGIPWQIEDMVYIYEAARMGKIDMGQLFGEGEDAKTYRKFFETVSNFRMGGTRMPMPEAVKRAQASTQFSGINEFGFVDLKSGEGDIKAFTDSLSVVLTEWQEADEGEGSWWTGWIDSSTPKALNYESTQLAKKVFLDEYRIALQETAHPDTALERAQESVRTRLKKSGGSLILVEDLQGIGPSQFKILAEVASASSTGKEIRKDASFVFLGLDQRGESMFALRGADGLSIADRLFKISEIRSMQKDGEVIKRINTLLEERNKPKKLLRGLRILGVPIPLGVGFPDL